MQDVPQPWHPLPPSPHVALAGVSAIYYCHRHLKEHSSMSVMEESAKLDGSFGDYIDKQKLPGEQLV